MPLPTGFTADGAARVAASTLAYERKPRGNSPQRNAPPRVSYMTARCGVSPSGGIPARVGSTPGSAVCTLYDFDGSTFSGTLSATVFNSLPYVVALGAIDIQVKVIQGYYFIDVQSCP